MDQTSDGWLGTVSVRASQEQFVNGSSHVVPGESVPKIAPKMPQPVAVIRMATAASTRTRAAIDNRNTRTMSAGKNLRPRYRSQRMAVVFDHGGIPQKMVPRTGLFPALYEWPPRTQAGPGDVGWVEAQRAPPESVSCGAEPVGLAPLDPHPTKRSQTLSTDRRRSAVGGSEASLARSALRSLRPASGPDQSAGSAGCKTASPGYLAVRNRFSQMEQYATANTYGPLVTWPTGSLAPATHCFFASFPWSWPRRTLSHVRTLGGRMPAIPSRRRPLSCTTRCGSRFW